MALLSLLSVLTLPFPVQHRRLWIAPLAWLFAQFPQSHPPFHSLWADTLQQRRQRGLWGVVKTGEDVLKSPPQSDSLGDPGLVLMGRTIEPKALKECPQRWGGEGLGGEGVGRLFLFQPSLPSCHSAPLTCKQGDWGGRREGGVPARGQQGLASERCGIDERDQAFVTLSVLLSVFVPLFLSFFLSYGVLSSR